MCISCDELAALKSLYSEFSLIYGYASTRPCEDSNKVIADFCRANAKTECSIENMWILKSLLERHQNMCNCTE
jgi:hypothetical protein